MIILQANNITKYFGSNCILNQVSLEVNTKDRIALVGRNGAGKTTLLKILSGENSFDEGEKIIPKDVQIGYMAQSSIIESEYTVWDELLHTFDHVLNLEVEIRALELKLSKTSTDSEKDLGDYDRLQEEYKRLGGYQYEADIRAILNGMQFHESQWNQLVSSLSGGQRTRLSLAKLLLQKPDLLILDEPTNHLDLDTLAWLEKYLQNYDGAILIVSHDRYFLDQVVNKVYEIKNHKMSVYHGNYSYYLTERQARYELDQKLFEKQQDEISSLEDFIQRNIARASTTKRAQSRRKTLEKIDRIQAPLLNSKKASFSFEIQRQSGNDVYQTSNYTLKIPNQETVLCSNLNLAIKKGDSIALIGPNGVGKSTLLKSMIVERLQPTLDSKMRFGSNIQLGYYDQEQANLNSNKDVLHELWDAYPSYNEAYIRTTLGNFLFFGDDVFKTVNMLSGGEKARLALAKLMLLKANFLILDEPTNHLDLDSKEVLEYALMDYPGTILFVSHDRYFMNKLATKVWAFSPSGIEEYLGDFEYYLEKKEEQIERKKLQELNTHKTNLAQPAQKSDFEQSREMKKNERKRQRRIEEIEAGISELEEKLTIYEEQLCDPLVFSDFEKTQEIQSYTQKAKEELEGLYEEWEALHS